MGDFELWKGIKRTLLVLLLTACSSDNGMERSDTSTPEPLVAPVVPVRFSSSDCSWTEGPPSALSRLESQTALIGNRLYTFSGFEDGLKISPETEIFDLNTSTWASGAPMPLAVTHMGAALVDGKVWIVGGFVGDHPGEAVAAVQIYDPNTDSWSRGPDLPSARASGALVYSEGVLHYFGGLQPDRRTDLNEHLVLRVTDSASGWSQKAALPDGRNHLGGIAVEGKVYAVGGQFGHDAGVDDLPFMDVYDPELNSWQRLSDLPVDRSHFEAGIFSFEGRIFVVGGRSDDAYAGDILVYDPNKDSWDTFCDLPENLLAPVSRIYGDRLYVINGGVDGVCCPVPHLRYIQLSVSDGS